MIARELCDYGLRWRGAAVDAQAYRARTDGLSIYSMQYGDEVSITPDLYRDFMLAHVCVRNGIEVDSDGRVTHVPEGSVFFSAPQDYVRLRWQEGCEQLIVRIPLNLLDPAGRGRIRRPAAILPRALTPIFVSQLNMAMQLARQGQDLDGLEEWVGHAEAGFARLAGMHLFHLAPAMRAGGRDPFAGRDRRERLEGFISSRIAQPIRLDDLAAAAGLGYSQLNLLTRQAFGCAPMTLVRRMRLEAARRDLESDAGQDLTQLALRYGFEHQGRFSQYYRAQFGELPRETRARLRGANRPATGRIG